MSLRRVGIVPVCAALAAITISKVWLRAAPGPAVRWSIRGDRGGQILYFNIPRMLKYKIRPLVRAVAGVSARWPFRATCLEQGIALVLLLKMAGVPARVTIGVVRSDAGLNGHAYVECGDRVLLGATQMEGLLPLTGLSCRG